MPKSYTPEPANKPIKTIHSKICSSGRYWQTRPGDSFYTIAIYAGTSVKTLKKLNPQIKPERIQVGQRVCLPLAPQCAAGVWWIVTDGDTLYTIAKAVGTSVKTLRELNPYLDPRMLLLGQTICLPK